jgi:sugar phosphate isomerase/epimerase
VTPGSTAPGTSLADAISRREFFVRSGVALGALSAARTIESRGTRQQALGRIGLQLYTLRDEMGKDVGATLQHVARIGYQDVEFAGYFGKSPADIRALLDANGLDSPSAHSADFPTMRTRWLQALEDARVMGHQYMVCASLPRNESQTADDYKRVAAFLNQRGEEAKRAGITLGYHNHNTEFKPLGSTTGYDVLIAECDPALVQMQMDLYWIVNGGKDPLSYFTQYPHHFFSVHVKDMDAAGNMADVGAGQLPFAAYLAAARKAGVKYQFVEHDTPVDPWASVTASYEYLRRLRY